MKFIFTTTLLFLTLFLFGQNPNKKTLGHEELVTWNRIQKPTISNDGNWILYNLKAEEGNTTLKIFDAKNQTEKTFERSEGAKISYDSRYVAFKIKADWDSVRMMKRQKVKKEDMPKDTLGIYDLQTQTLEKVAGVKSFKMPEKWSGWLVYHKDVEKAVKDTSETVVDTLEMR